MLFKTAAGTALVTYALGAVASCAYGTILHPRAEDGTVKVNTFGYSGSKGPANWVALNPAKNALCANGTNQSPINMISGSFTTIPAAELSLSIPDMKEGATFENLGTTVEVVAKAGTIKLRGVAYTLQQFHFHHPSEHLQNGTSMPMEMHMVFQGKAGEIAVIGVFVDLDDGSGVSPPAQSPPAATTRSVTTSLAATSVTTKPSATVTGCPSGHKPSKMRRGQTKPSEQLPAQAGGFFHVNTPNNAATTPSKLLETIFSSVEKIATPGAATKTDPLVMSELVNTLVKGSFQTYSGSLTTPPCSEGVSWLVSNQKVSIKLKTYLKARSVLGYNARFPQNAPGEGNVLALACGGH